jgi:hypothetical protein
VKETLHLRKPTKEKSVIREDEGLPIGPRDKHTYKFVYTHFPKAWTYDLELGFLPTIKKITARPGLNGVKKDGSMALTLARVTEMGGTVLDPKDERLGEYMDYVCYYPIRGSNAKYYVDFNQSAVVLPSNEVIWNTSEQRETWDIFLAFIRDSGMIRPLLREVYVGMVERERNKRDGLIGRVDRNPHLKKRLDSCEAKLEGMAASWDAHNTALAKTLKPTTPKRRVEKVTT